MKCGVESYAEPDILTGEKLYFNFLKPISHSLEKVSFSMNHRGPDARNFVEKKTYF